MTRKDEIVSYLRNNPYSSIPQIIDATRIPERSVKQILYAMRDNGTVRIWRAYRPIRWEYIPRHTPIRTQLWMN